MKTFKLLVLSAVLVVPLIALTTLQTSPSIERNTGLEPQTAVSGAKDLSQLIYDSKQKFIKPDEQTLLNTLGEEAFAITQRCGTEEPFNNAFWDHKEKGIYVDVVSGQPLFASIHKFDSDTGWPSFWRPIDSTVIEVASEDVAPEFGFEVKSSQAQSHLGHVFLDGPDPTGLRFCINSASLVFVPYSEMEARGYGEYMSLFE